MNQTQRIQQDLKFVAKRKNHPAFPQIWEAFKKSKFNDVINWGSGNKAWARRDVIRDQKN